MKIKQTIKLSLFGLFTGGLLLVGAQTPTFAAKCGGVTTSIISCTQDNSGKDIQNNAIWGLLLQAINILTVGIGLAAAGGIIWGSILWTSAGGNPAQVKKAREVITNVVIGIAAYALMYSLLNFIIPGGIFS